MYVHHMWGGVHACMYITCGGGVHMHVHVCRYNYTYMHVEVLGTSKSSIDCHLQQFQAFFKGKMKIAGNIMLGQKLQALFPSNMAKL